MSDEGFRDRIAVVTGGASGIGRATALALAARGARVVIADIDETGAKETCGAAAERGGEARAVAMDLTSDASIEAAADEILGLGATPGILINAAGWDRIMPFVETTPDFVDQVVRLNLQGPLKLTRRLLPAMIEAEAGRIVNVASDAGRVGSSGETVYAAAKGGVIAFTRSLARETARYRISVNCVCPGPTDTPLFRSLPEKLQQGLIRAIPFRRLAAPEEIADALLFFASDRAAYVTGQTLSVSGGLTMAG